MAQKTLNLRNDPLPSRCYGDHCPGCNDRALPIDATIDAVGFTWHIHCYAVFTREYGEWLSRFAGPDVGEDFGDLAGERYGQVVGSDPTGYHIGKART